MTALVGKRMMAIPEGIKMIASATRGDVSDALREVAQRAEGAALGTETAFSEYLQDIVPPALDQFDQTAESALNAAADLGDAFAEALEQTSESYEEADKNAADDLVALTAEL